MSSHPPIDRSAGVPSPRIELTDISSLFACPRCRTPLAVDAGTYRCPSPSCPVGRTGPFRMVGRWPVFVDFERSSLRPNDVQSMDQRETSSGTSGSAIDRVPDHLRFLWKPANHVAERNMRQLLSLLATETPLVLVVGGGTMGNGVQAIYEDRRVRVAGFDIYTSPLTLFVADAHQIPFVDGCVDAVVVQAVLEHVLDPQHVVGEIRRVLREGGLVYAETPFLQQVHAGSRDFTRYTSSGHRYLFRDFEEIAAGPVAGPGTQLLWSIDHLFRGLLRSNTAGRIVRALFFWLRYLDRLVPEAFAMDNASAYFFLGRRAGSPLTPQEIVGYYRGAQRGWRNG